jgi:hypothetical protein
MFSIPIYHADEEIYWPAGHHEVDFVEFEKNRSSFWAKTARIVIFRLSIYQPSEHVY